MIKQIALRGISRTPSDRATADGGCSESLNVQLRDGELTPAIPSRVVRGSGSGVPHYIHATSAYRHIILLSSGNPVSVMWETEGNMQTPTLIMTLPEGEQVKGLTHMGNILILSTDRSAYMVYWENGSYHNLGSEVPRPRVEFTVEHQEVEDDQVSTGKIIEQYDGLTNYLIYHTPGDFHFWNLAYDAKMQMKGYPEIQNAAVLFFKDAEALLWGKISARRTALKNKDIFMSPMLARYALRLYSGDYIYVSAPFMIEGSAYGEMVSSVIRGRLTGFQDMDHYKDSQWTWNIRYTGAYKLSVNVSVEGLDKTWKGLIESVDLFVSPAIDIPSSSMHLAKALANPDGDSEYTTIVEYEDKSFNSSETSGDAVRKSFAEALEAVSNFYLVESWAVDELPVEKTVTPLTQDELLLKERLIDSEDIQISTTETPNIYNSRLLYTQQLITLPKGHETPSALINERLSRREDTLYMSIFYHVRDPYGTEHLVAGYQNFPLTPELTARAFITYPSPRCYQADLYLAWGDPQDIEQKVTLPMKPHPILICSMGFWGLDSILWSANAYDGDDRKMTMAQALPSRTNPSYESRNRLFFSEVDNPFVWPDSKRRTFTHDIIDVSPTTMALVSGQLRASDLYVFTTGGIDVVALTDEGGFGPIESLSRDVAVKGSVTALDKGAVFITRSGVMLLDGGQIRDISAFMLGRHYTIDDESMSILRAQGYGYLEQALTDDMRFMEFMDGAVCVPDPKGRRLIFFSLRRDYQYVYMFDTGTWHKLFAADRYDFIGRVTSYPDTYMIMQSHGERIVWNALITDVDEDEVATLARHLDEFIHPPISPIAMQASVAASAEADGGDSGDNGTGNLIVPGYLDRCDQNYTREQIIDILNEYGEIRITGIHDALIRWFTYMVNLGVNVRVETASEEREYPIGLMVDYSTPLRPYSVNDVIHNPEEDYVDAVVVTRPFDLENPDVLKSIMAIFLRKSDRLVNLKYMLLASNDGRHYVHLNSLRGKSYKLFRMIIIGNMQVTDTLSWVDVDFATRFTNKLR